AKPFRVDRKLNRIAVLELVNEDMIEFVQESLLAFVEALLNGRKIQDVLFVEIFLPSALKRTQLRRQPSGTVDSLDAVRRICARTSGEPRRSVMRKNPSDEIDSFHHSSGPLLVPRRAK